jgi:hypothetical protein
MGKEDREDSYRVGISKINAVKICTFPIWLKVDINLKPSD